VRHRF
jgi:hypothetical protein